MALRSDNVPVFVFRTLFQSQTQSALHFARCTTAACTQTERRILQSAAGTNVFHWPSLAVAPGAHPILAYTHSNNFQLAICGSANCDPVTVRTLYSWSNSAQARGSGLSMAILANSQPVLAHYSRSDGVLVTTCTNPSCTAFTHVQIAADGDNLPALQLRSDGRPGVVYYDRAAKTIDYVVCGSADCSTVQSRATVASVSDLPGLVEEIGFALDASDRPRIAHAIGSSYDLVYRTCSTASCLNE